MNKYIYYIILVLLAFVSCKEADMASDQEKSHIKFYGGSYQAEGNDIKQLSDGCFVAFGTISFSEISKSMYLVKTDRLGNEIWSKVITDTISKTGVSFEVMPDGGFVMLGNTITSPSRISVARTDANGVTLWTKYISRGKGIKGYSIKRTSDNGLVIAGSYTNANDDLDAMLFFVDFAGNNEKLITAAWDENDEAKDVIELGNGIFIMAGYRTNISTKGSNACFWIVNSKDEDFPFLHGLVIEKNKVSSIERVKFIGNSNYLMCGQVNTLDSAMNTFVAKIKVFSPDNTTDYTIKPVWKRSYGSKNKDFATSCEMLSDNDFAILGTTYNDLGQTSMTLYKIDSLGNETSAKKEYGGTSGSSVSQSGNCILKTQDGGLVTTGVNSYSKTTLLSIIKFDSNGNF
ncbi:MAG TPA: hypothetical protein PK252_09145 [Bacteroidales bacterium]|nr:hypothetical protein [Bacteroidales bacterium]